MAELYRYAAFISYSSKDAAFARRLHRALESYGIPSALGKFDIIGGGKQNRIYPVFRDREELSAGHLGDQIEANLKASATLIVVCSPDGAASPWVQKEIEFFASQGRHGKIFAIIPDTAPLADESGADATQSCFPPAFRGDALSGDKLEPLAADARKGKDGFRNAWLKIVAGMVGVSSGQIIDRDKKRRRQQNMVAGGGFGLAVAMLLFANAWNDAHTRRALYATIAERMQAEGRAPASVAYALAAMPGRTDALIVRGARSQQVLAVVPRPKVQLDYGRGGEYIEFASGGDVSLRLDESNMLQLWDVSSGSRTTIAEAQDFALSPDETILATLEDRGRVMVRLLQNVDDPLFVGAGASGVHQISFEGEALVAGGIFADAVRFMDPSGIAPPFEIDLSGSVSSSRRGGALIVKRENRSVVVYDLRHEGASREVGHFVSFNTSPNVRWFAGVQRGGGVSLLDLHSSAPPRIIQSNAPVRNAYLLADGSFIVAYLADGRWSALPTTAASQVIDLPFFSDGLLISASNATVVGDGPDRTSLAIVDLSNGSMRSLDIGAYARERLLSDDGGIVVYRIGEDAWFYARTKDGNPSALGSLTRAPLISPDSVFIVTEDRERMWVLHDAATGRRTLLGNLGDVRDAEIVPPNRLLLHTNDRGARLYDLGTVADPRVGDVCRVNSENVQPFETRFPDPAVGANTLEESDAVFRALVGRPWNPCDWRGLLAILPSAERGDGWLEGARQWLRLLNVRYFGGDDWSCEETTSRASESTRAARAQMCEMHSSAALHSRRVGED